MGTLDGPARDSDRLREGVPEGCVVACPHRGGEALRWRGVGARWGDAGLSDDGALGLGGWEFLRF